MRCSSGTPAPSRNVVGAVNGSWAVANTLLGFERGGRATVLWIGYRKELDRITHAARSRGRNTDPIISQRLAYASSHVEILRYLGMRALTTAVRNDQPGLEAWRTGVAAGSSRRSTGCGGSLSTWTCLTPARLMRACWVSTSLNLRSTISEIAVLSIRPARSDRVWLRHYDVADERDRHQL
jgi:alkylation response protein AidB-like acyl-CoA dehydrogenase